MNPRITEGKKKRLEAVADARGVIAALAIDQRSAIRKLFGQALGIDPSAVPSDKIVQFKQAVSRVLTPYASAILLDTEFGLSAARERQKKTGLLLAYEKTGYDKSIPGRIPQLLDRWSAGRLVSAGADCVKILLYYSSTSANEVNDLKHAFIERVGAECAEEDVPLFLELVSYGEGMDEKGVEFARIKPEVVSRGMEEFSKPQYRVDVLKVGVPVTLAFVEGSPSAVSKTLYSRTEAINCYRKAASVAKLPFIYLSEGVTNASFKFALELAAEAGVHFSGVLCGRATWQDGVAVFVNNGMSGLEEWLSSEGAQNIQNVNRCLEAAQPWHSAVGEARAAKSARRKGKGRS